jgi:hypothetical protein
MSSHPINALQARYYFSHCFAEGGHLRRAYHETMNWGIEGAAKFSHCDWSGSNLRNGGVAIV